MAYIMSLGPCRVGFGISSIICIVESYAVTENALNDCVSFDVIGNRQVLLTPVIDQVARPSHPASQIR